MHPSSIAAAAALVLFATLCHAGEESILELRYEEPATDPTKAPPQIKLPGDCSVIVALPNDVRRNKETLGTTFRDNPILSKQPVVNWLQEALLSLRKMGAATTPASGEATPAAADATVLSTDLSKMYIWNHGMNLHATLVVKARIQTGSAPAVERSYRVVGTKLNWMNGDSEFISTLNLAANRLLLQVATDLGNTCTSKTQI